MHAERCIKRKQHDDALLCPDLHAEHGVLDDLLGIFETSSDCIGSAPENIQVGV